MLKRRTFIQLSSAAVLAPLAGCRTSASKNTYSAYARVPLGTTGLLPTRLCFGTGIRSFNRNSELLKKGRDYAVALLRSAYERGIRCFDLADTYGSHGPVAEALAPFPRDSYVLITKIWWRNGGIPEADHAPVPQLIERFLRELRTDHLDLVQLHCVDNPTWAADLAPQMEALEEAKQAGKIRAHGISIHAFSALHAAPEVPWLDAAHVRINPFGKMMAGPVDRNLTEIRRLKLAGKGVIGMKILGEGALSNDPAAIDASLALALNSNVVDVLDIGFLSLDQIDDIAARIARVRIPSA